MKKKREEKVRNVGSKKDIEPRKKIYFIVFFLIIIILLFLTFSKVPYTATETKLVKEPYTVTETYTAFYNETECESFGFSYELEPRSTQYWEDNQGVYSYVYVSFLLTNNDNEKGDFNYSIEIKGIDADTLENKTFIKGPFTIEIKPGKTIRKDLTIRNTNIKNDDTDIMIDPPKREFCNIVKKEREETRQVSKYREIEKQVETLKYKTRLQAIIDYFNQ